MPAGVTSALLVGTASQPVLETARLLGEAAIAAGLDVSVHEHPSATPRGGVRWAQVRMGSEVRSPRAPAGGVHVLLALEALEGVRAAPLLAPGALVAIDLRVAPTWRMRARLDPVPGDPVAALLAATPRVIALDARALLGPGVAPQVGALLLGAAASALPVREEDLRAAVADAGRRAPALADAFERGLAAHRAWAEVPASDGQRA